MSVYGEVLFAENCITGFIILVLAGKVMGLARNKVRLAAGAVMCGAYSFILFVPMNWYLALLSKLMFSAIVVIVSFHIVNVKALVKAAGVFYVISFLMGGVTIALMYVLKAPFLTANGSFVLKGVTFIQLAAGVAATWFLGSWLADLLRMKAHKDSVIKNAVVKIGESSWTVKCLIDTGNSLKEPVTGYPAAVVSRQLGEKLLNEDLQLRACLIPYNSVGGKGIMQGIRSDSVTVENKEIKKIVLAISHSDFAPWNGIEEYELLLHQQLLEGEEYYD